MKCPKCGYHSFDHLDSCKKCGQGLVEHKEKFKLRGFIAPGQSAMAEPEPEPVTDENYEEEDVPADGPVDFGFDFLDEVPRVGEPAKEIPLGKDDSAVSINQPFGADSETIPSDPPAEAGHNDSKNKPEKGSEFAF